METKKLQAHTVYRKQGKSSAITIAIKECEPYYNDTIAEIMRT